MSKPLFDDTDLALCVVDALVAQRLLETSIRVPELAPDEDDDLDDESESWRDRLENNQTRAIDRLLALLEQHRELVSQVRELSGSLIHIAEYYEPSFRSLAGIQACVGLERIEIWSSYRRLDLSPLCSLPKLRTVDVGGASIANYDPLLEIESLREVIGELPPAIAEQLRQRNVEIKQWQPS